MNLFPFLSRLVFVSSKPRPPSGSRLVPRPFLGESLNVPHPRPQRASNQLLGGFICSGLSITRSQFIQECCVIKWDVKTISYSWKQFSVGNSSPWPIAIKWGRGPKRKDDSQSKSSSQIGVICFVRSKHGASRRIYREVCLPGHDMMFLHQDIEDRALTRRDDLY